MTQEGEGTIVDAGSPWPSNMAYSTWTYMCDHWQKVKLIVLVVLGYPQMWAGGVNLMYVYFERNCEEGVSKAGLWSGPWFEKEKERGLWVVRLKMRIMWSLVRYKDFGLLGYGDNGVSQRELWCVVHGWKGDHGVSQRGLWCTVVHRLKGGDGKEGYESVEKGIMWSLVGIKKLVY